jgi:hypothetical protein
MIALVLAAFALVACGGEPVAVVARPSPSVAALMPPAPTFAPTAIPARVVTSVPVAPGRAEPASFVYLWPEYLPAGMQPAPAESRIAEASVQPEGEIGYFVVTFNAGSRKLVVGGGATEPLPVSGTVEALTVDGHEARLVTNGEQRQLLISGGAGVLFVFGVGLSAEELVRVAEALREVDAATLRERVGIS